MVTRQEKGGINGEIGVDMHILLYIKEITNKDLLYSTGKVKVAQPCPTLCDPMGYTVHGILQARTLEWVAIPFSRGSSQPRD